MCHWKRQFKNGRYKKKEHCPEYNDTYVMGQYLMFCAHFHIPFSTGIGNRCYPSGCQVHWLLTFSQGVEEFHQVCYLQRKSHTVFAVAGWSKIFFHSMFNQKWFPLNMQSHKKNFIWPRKKFSLWAIPKIQSRCALPFFSNAYFSRQRASSSSFCRAPGS